MGDRGERGGGGRMFMRTSRPVACQVATLGRIILPPANVTSALTFEIARRTKFSRVVSGTR